MFAKLYPATSELASFASRTKRPPRIITLHGLMGSGRNWVGVSRALSTHAASQQETASYLRYDNDSDTLSSKTEVFSSIATEVLTLDWRNHGRSVHMNNHGLIPMACDLDFILRKVNCCVLDDLPVSEKSMPVARDCKDYGFFGDIDENDLSWKGILGNPEVDRKQAHTRENTMWYVPFTEAQKRRAENIFRCERSKLEPLTVDARSEKNKEAQQPIFLMAHSMGGAALMHFLNTRYAKEWEAHKARRRVKEEEYEAARIASRLFRREGDIETKPVLTPENDPLFPYITISGVIIVDIGPCERPSYSQKLGGAVVAVKTLPIPTRRKTAVASLSGSEGTNYVSGSASHADCGNRGNTKIPDQLTIPCPKEPLCTRSETEKHVMRLGPRAIFDPRSQSSLWIARYLLTNVVENDSNKGKCAITEAPPIRALPLSEKCANLDDAPERNLLLAIDLIKSPLANGERESGESVMSQTLHWEPNIDVIVRDLPKNTWVLAAGSEAERKGASIDDTATPLSGVPTLFVFGADSPYWHHTSARNAIFHFYPPFARQRNDRGLNINHRYPSVRFVPKAGHFVMTEKQKDFTATVKSFVAQVLGKDSV